MIYSCVEEYFFHLGMLNGINRTRFQYADVRLKSLVEMAYWGYLIGKLGGDDLVVIQTERSLSIPYKEWL